VVLVVVQPQLMQQLQLVMLEVILQAKALMVVRLNQV
jgi:hypothetical protein